MAEADSSDAHQTAGTAPAAIPTLSLDPIGSGDHARLRAWLQLPGVQAWWGTRDRAEAEVAIAMSSPSAICRIVRVDGEAIGYAQAIDNAIVGGGGSPPGHGDSGTWDCAVVIAAEAHRGLGYGGAALRLLTAEVFATTLAMACALRIPITKEHAVRAIEAAGFRWLRIEQDASLGRVWLMQCERPHR